MQSASAYSGESDLLENSDRLSAGIIPPMRERTKIMRRRRNPERKIKKKATPCNVRPDAFT